MLLLPHLFQCDTFASQVALTSLTYKVPCLFSAY